jgi:hypothetical protein
VAYPAGVHAQLRQRRHDRPVRHNAGTHRHVKAVQRRCKQLPGVDARVVQTTEPEAAATQRKGRTVGTYFPPVTVRFGVNVPLARVSATAHSNSGSVTRPSRPRSGGVVPRNDTREIQRSRRNTTGHGTRRRPIAGQLKKVNKSEMAAGGQRPHTQVAA